MTAKRKYPATDPVTTEIIRNGVLAVTEEMKTNLMRTAYNIIIYEALDFTVGLFTPKGETVSIGLGLPMFIRGMAETIKAKIEHFGIENIHPGDILVTNDGYVTGSHLNHVTFSLPIFQDKELVGFACCMGHWIDIGGQLGGVTTDIYSEGIQIPILKYHSRGVVNRDLEEIIKMNVRIPSRAMGDLRAQITAVKTGERRFLELVNRYGKDAVHDSIAAIMDQTEAYTREQTLSIPDGVYEAESYMDDDGLNIGTPVPIRVKVIVEGDEMTIDLTNLSNAGTGIFQLRTGDGCRLRPGRLQMPDVWHRLSDQRGRVPQPQDHRAAGQSRQRRPARCAPVLDDDADDSHRYRVQGGGTGDPRPHHRRPPCGPGGLFLLRHQSQGVRILSRQFWPLGRRLGRQNERGRSQCHGLHQRRRYPQQSQRTGRGEISGAGGELFLDPGFRRSRPLIAAASGRKELCAPATTSPSTPASNAPIACRGGSRAAATRPATRWHSISTAVGMKICPTPRWR